MQKEQSLTLDLATAKIEAYCSKAEHCTSEVVTKLKSWNINERQIAEIVARLCKEKYINDLRYSRCYVKDKFRYNHWGRIKIAQTLRFKNINENDIKEAIEELDQQEYETTLKRLLAQKRKSIKASSDYERNGKLVRFALGRGFEMSIINKYLNLDEDF
ncbi:MAG: RecX family transcriptional regulator [Paraprevotella sp.]|nr:RecX family transcriptional regulator [Paraprevotella sp.]